MSRRVASVELVLLLTACRAVAPVAPSLPNHAPSAKIVAPGIGPEGTPIRFSAEASGDSDGDSLTYTWLFGDGIEIKAAEVAINHSYRNNGTYSVTLIVQDARGGADTAQATITVANVAPQLSVFRASRDTVPAGALFDVEIRYADPGVDDSVTAWFWVSHAGSSEGAILETQGVRHLQLSQPGTYTLSVLLQDNDGASTYRQVDIVVSAPPN